MHASTTMLLGRQVGNQLSANDVDESLCLCVMQAIGSYADSLHLQHSQGVLVADLVEAIVPLCQQLR